MGINNPIPRSLKLELKKAAKVLASFIKPNQFVGQDQIIPPHVLKNAKGLAIITVLKAGFIFSGRAGSGVIVARLPDGTWSAPSAIVTAGAGVGGQIGAELTDFVFILNSASAVESFAQLGSVTLGGNVSVAAGPLGRNAEAAGTASLKSASAVFSYSKTKGLFAGISLEGSAIVERREANRKFYGPNCKAKSILSGQVSPPPGADPLMRVLESRVFNSGYIDSDYDYDDIPDSFSDSTRSQSRNDYSDDSDDDYATRRSQKNNYSGRSRSGESREFGRDSYRNDTKTSSKNEIPRTYTNSKNFNNGSSKSWEDDIYDNKLSSGPSRPPASSKPNFGGQSKSNSNQAIALFTFKGEQAGDLPFKKGDVIEITQKSETVDDWWTGRNNGRSGIFPANYVELI